MATTTGKPWLERIEAAKTRGGRFEDEDIEAAKSWMRCAVGELAPVRYDNGDAPYSKASYVDLLSLRGHRRAQEIVDKGLAFADAVSDDSPQLALEIYLDIVELLADGGAP